jgi:recombinational DNA repair protein (RecF pathway)
MTEQGTLFGECSHSRTEIIPEKRGPHHARKVCSVCRKFLGWIPKPETLMQQRENQRILGELTRLPNLSEWEREFIRDVTTHKHLSPKQQKTILELMEKYLKGAAQ